MSSSHGLKRPLRSVHSLLTWSLPKGCRFTHIQSHSSDGRNRLSGFWIPAQRKSGDGVENDSHQLLLRGGFLRQAHSGIFHLLPLGLRVQDKVERLIDRHMNSIGASKVSLSSISSQELWQQSGRLDGRNSEFFKFEDRKEGKYLLSPTHEEEITTIVADAVHSYKDLPLRLYQVTRKYRDEARPRQGLLRGREFVMKDLYTFDSTKAEAMATYEQVRTAYCAFLDDLRIPYLVAKADSGNMGGNLSHEYHFVSKNGEDTIISCNSCDIVLNEELYHGSTKDGQVETSASDSYRIWHIKSQDSTKSVAIYVPEATSDINTYAIKQQMPDLDTASQGRWLPNDSQELNNTRTILLDPRLSNTAISTITKSHKTNSIHKSPNLLTQLNPGDPCPSCSTGKTHLSPAVEIGHTFHLGQRYSTSLSANILNSSNSLVPIEMGCHGIGITRLIGAVASLLSDSKGLNWPLPIAPFGVLIVGSNSASAEDLGEVYDQVVAGTKLDAVIDDREKGMGWKLNDGDLVGYPFIVVLGKGWAKGRRVELQCRRLGVKEEVGVEEVVGRVQGYCKEL